MLTECSAELFEFAPVGNRVVVAGFDGGAITSRVHADAGAGTYRRVILRHGIPIGAILLGTTAGVGELRSLVEGGLELEKLKHRVVPEERVAAS